MRLTSPLALAQGASLVGLWGLTFPAVAVFASPAVLADTAAETRRPWLPLALAVAALAALALYGSIRLSATPTSFVEGVRLRIMQPNVPQDTKFKYSAKQQVMSHYLALSDRATGPNNRGRARRHPPDLAGIGVSLPARARSRCHGADRRPAAAGTVLITGAARGEPAAGAERPLHAYNSIYVIDHDGSILGVYDKVHLVPFGEYLPFQPLLEGLGLRQLTKVAGRIPTRRPAPAAGRAARAAGRAVDLLRDHLPRPGGAGRRTSGLAVEPDQ